MYSGIFLPLNKGDEGVVMGCTTFGEMYGMEDFLRYCVDSLMGALRPENTIRIAIFLKRHPALWKIVGKQISLYIEKTYQEKFGKTGILMKSESEKGPR
eukprot:TRINITY_DN13737_c0_g1_i1.p1 TRINITY_DN13737_c0_g1~~TRINITY_DN13737_c0_g1_i1.p1  ORF type:complete len:99 (-),score=10.19 TRINITY_DN13737_c0_g1_i1:268-564(-)